METLAWLARLVACDTTSRYSNLHIIDLIKDWMQHHQIAFRLTHDPHEQKANLLATIPAADGSVTGGLMFSGHTDVVPVDNQPWDTNPFEITQIGDNIYGRGTADMKGFLAVILALIPQFQQMKLKKPLHFAFSYDEEVGCKGVPLLIDDMVQAGIRPDACIVGEPTMMLPIVAHKGIQVFLCRVNGYATHSSLTPQGCNAIEYAAEIITFLRDIANHFKKDGPFDQQYDVPFTTISTNMIHGGIATNTIPALCEFIFEFRHLPEINPKAIVEKIESHIQKNILVKMQTEQCSANVELDNIAGVPSFKMDTQAELIKLIQNLSGKQETHKVAYATEAGLFQEVNIPTIVCGPGSIEQAHRANEFVTVQQLQECEKFLVKVVEAM